MVQFRNRTQQQRRSRDGWSAACDDPYKASSPDYSDRTRENVTHLPGGMIRVDIGEPILRQSCEPQPVPCGSPASLPVASVVDSSPAKAPHAPQRELSYPDTKPGIGKHRRPG